jgi:hypothetical protein
VNNRWVALSMPKADAEALRRELACIREADLQTDASTRAKLVRRLDAVLKGKDLRVTNQHNTHTVKRPRMGLDLRRKPKPAA